MVFCKRVMLHEYLNFRHHLTLFTPMPPERYDRGWCGHTSVEMRNMPSGKALQLRGRASVCVCHTLVRNPEDKDGSHKFWCKEDLEKKYSLISYTEKCIWYFDNCSTDDSYFICHWYLILITSTAPIMYIYKWCAFLCKHMTLFFLYFSISSLNYFELVILIELCTGCISH